MDALDYIYNVVRRGSDGIDAIYEEYIIDLVGLDGITMLIENKLLETCGVINGRQLYTLIKKGDPEKELRDNLLVTMGMRAAYMHNRGIIELPSGTIGEKIVADFISKAVDDYIELDIEDPFDLYIEDALQYEFGQ